MKILMVCLGNICRSPIAEGVMQKLADDDGLIWEVDSAGTGSYHINSPPDQRSITVAKQHGLDISQQKARVLKKADLETFNHIYVMDRQNYDNVIKLAGNAEQISKVELFIPERIVPDPYNDDVLFLPVFEMIATQCEKLFAQLKNENR
jgi:protein-tyrosine phosphatase